MQHYGFIKINFLAGVQFSYVLGKLPEYEGNGCLSKFSSLRFDQYLSRWEEEDLKQSHSPFFLGVLCFCLGLFAFRLLPSNGAVRHCSVH